MLGHLFKLSLVSIQIMPQYSNMLDIYILRYWYIEILRYWELNCWNIETNWAEQSHTQDFLLKLPIKNIPYEILTGFHLHWKIFILMLFSKLKFENLGRNWHSVAEILWAHTSSKLKSQEYLISSSWNIKLSMEVVFQWRLSSNGGPLPMKVVFQWRLSSNGGRLLTEVVFQWRSSSNGGCLPMEVVFQWRSSSNGGRLPMEVVFQWRSSSNGGCLPMKVVFQWR